MAPGGMEIFPRLDNSENPPTKMSEILPFCWDVVQYRCGALAQLIERRIRIAEVMGLNPVRSTTILVKSRQCGIFSCSLYQK